MTGDFKGYLIVIALMIPGILLCSFLAKALQSCFAFMDQRVMTLVFFCLYWFVLAKIKAVADGHKKDKDA